MIRLVGGVLLLVCSSQALAAGATDFGVRLVRTSERTVNLVTSGVAPVERPALLLHATLPRSVGFSSLSSAVAFASKFGHVTSTYRSPEHNRAVGGVRNSYHLSGRAIDIIPRAGMSHHALEAALVNAGYRLRESLNEGDHSHFAFDFGSSGSFAAVRPARSAAPEVTGGTSWKVVYAPGAHAH